MVVKNKKAVISGESNAQFGTALPMSALVHHTIIVLNWSVLDVNIQMEV